MANLLLNSLILFVTAAFHINLLPHINTSTFVAAQLLITPPSASSEDNIPSCFVGQNGSSEQAVITGNSSHMCRADVSFPYGKNILVTFLTELNAGNFWVERLGMFKACKERYIFVSDLQDMCNITFHHTRLMFNLHGSFRLLLKEQLPSEMAVICPEDQGSPISSEQSTSFSCSKIDGANKTIMCNTNSVPSSTYHKYFPKNTPVCTYVFNATCNTELDDNHGVALKCDDNLDYKNQRQVIIFMANTQLIDLRNNGIIAIKKGAFHAMVNLKGLDLSQNRLEILSDGIFEGLVSLETLIVNSNKLEILESDVFQDIRHISSLLMNSNKIRTFPKNLFRNLKMLKQLHAARNHISSLNIEMFTNLVNLDVLNLQTNSLVDLDANMFRILNLRALTLKNNPLNQVPLNMFDYFAKQNKITYINLQNCTLKKIPKITFMSKLGFFHLENNPLTLIERDTFAEMNPMTELSVSQYEICECYMDKNAVCEASGERSPYLTCDRLLSDRVLVVLMWVIGLNALGGNAFVLVLKLLASERRSVQDILLSSLALSDLLMGIYMIIVASADIYFGDYFPMNAESWRSGIICRVSGAISITSSEGSVFFVTLISIDRFINIQFPYSARKINKNAILLISILTWVLAVALGVIPSVLAGRNFKFYDNSHVCIGLPLALTDRFIPIQKEVTVFIREIPFFRTVTEFDSIGKHSGMYFSSALFLGLNGLCYFIILMCYIGILVAVKRSSAKIGRNSELKKQIQLTVRVAAIVATDFCCWFPVILLGILVQVRVLELPASVFAWLVTFVLPINSAINPYLYTIGALITKFRKKCHQTQSEVSGQVKTVSSMVSETRT